MRKLSNVNHGNPVEVKNEKCHQTKRWRGTLARRPGTEHRKKREKEKKEKGRGKGKFVTLNGN